jgi:hypothetical protein
MFVGLGFVRLIENCGKSGCVLIENLRKVEGNFNKY